MPPPGLDCQASARALRDAERTLNRLARPSYGMPAGGINVSSSAARSSLDCLTEHPVRSAGALGLATRQSKHLHLERQHTALTSIAPRG